MSGTSSSTPVEPAQPSLLRSINRYVAVVVFFALLALPIAWFGRASFVPSPLHENRVMSPFPEDLSVRTFQQFDRWFSDRFGMRDALVHYGSRLQTARTGTPTNQNVVVGPNQWLFFDQYHVPGQPHFADDLGKDPLSASKLRMIGANLMHIEQALSACRIPFYLVIAPDKQNIYPEEAGLSVAPGTASNADQLLAYLHVNAPTLRVIDLRPALLAAKTRAPYDLYKRTDTHWNSLGGFFGYQAMAQRLTRDGIMPASPSASLSAWQVKQVPFDDGDIAINLLSLPGYFKDFNTHFAPKLPETVDVSTSTVELEVTSNPTGHGRLLMYRDSFAGELMPFLSRDFAHMHSILGRGVDGNVIGETRPNVMIFQIVARNVRTLTDAPVNLENACKS